MSEIRAYRQIVELQMEIVRLSQANARLEDRCKQVQAQLILRHQELARPKSPTRALIRCVTLRTVALGNHLSALMRSPALKPILQRVSQSILF